jgi:hypothetical protein
LDQVYAEAGEDLRSITRAKYVQVGDDISNEAIPILETGTIKVALLN